MSSMSSGTHPTASVGSPTSPHAGSESVSTLTVRSAVPDKHCYYSVEVGVKPTSNLTPLLVSTSHGTLTAHGIIGIIHPVGTIIVSIGILS